MPTGIYKRTPEQLAVMRANFAKGREPSVRAKVAALNHSRAVDHPEWCLKVSEATKAAMQRPEVRIKHLNFKGGNGQKPVQIVATLTPLLMAQGFKAEYPIKTAGHGTGLRAATCYKVDMGNPKTKEAIEFDGPCHRPLARRALDVKKTAVLEALGWKVTRIKHD